MRWLVRLVTPPDGIVLDPFAGTGTTGEAAWREGFRAVLFERDPAHIPDIERRMALVLSGSHGRRAAAVKAREERRPAQPLGGLFAGLDPQQGGRPAQQQDRLRQLRPGRSIGPVGLKR